MDLAIAWRPDLVPPEHVLRDVQTLAQIVELLASVEDLGRNLFLELLPQLLYLKPHFADVVLGLCDVGCVAPDGAVETGTLSLESRQARDGNQVLLEKVANADKFLIDQFQLLFGRGALATQAFDLGAVLLDAARQNANLSVKRALAVAELQRLVEEDTRYPGLVLAPQQVLRELNLGEFATLRCEACFGGKGEVKLVASSIVVRARDVSSRMKRTSPSFTT